MIRSTVERLLYHGSRANFEKFNPSSVKTGEGAGVGVGFYFVGNFEGAAMHAIKHNHKKGDPLVYVIKLRPGTKILERELPIEKHNAEILNYWRQRMPSQCWGLSNKRDWFNRLYKNHPSFELFEEFDERKICEILLRAGFDVIENFEDTDTPYHSRTTLVLNTNVIEIVEKRSAI